MFGGKPLGAAGFADNPSNATITTAAGTATATGTASGVGLEAAMARPSTDISAGTWTDHLGGTTNLYTRIDEEFYDDADYIKSADLTSGTDTSEVKLGSINDPSSSSNHVVRYRYRRQGDRTTVSLTVSLRQGASTEIAAWTHTNVGTTTVTAEQTLSGPQADAITDYSDLRLRFVAA